ncbi:MAG: NAD(P)-dependent oxidoreductase [bacterium]|nr:NAD(P)-dependent oxidoreductase [bacterium]
MHIGFVGLGQMGRGMAASLLAAGHDLTVYNRSPAKAAPLAAQGARVAPTVADACRGEAVVTMLADDAAVAEVAFGDAGIVAHLPAGAVHVSASTIGVATCERLAAAHAAAGQRFVAAPVFGRPDAAAARKLVVVAAGPADALDACTPLFDAVGQRTFRVGDAPPAASLIKVSGNFLIAAAIEALGEAVALVAKAGVDRQQYVDILTSTLFAAPVYRTYGAIIAEQRWEPAGFAAPLGLKDVRLALAAGDALRVPLPLASLLRDRLLELLARGDEHLDWSAIARLAAEAAGE